MTTPRPFAELAEKIHTQRTQTNWSYTQLLDILETAFALLSARLDPPQTSVPELPQCLCQSLSTPPHKCTFRAHHPGPCSWESYAPKLTPEPAPPGAPERIWLMPNIGDAPWQGPFLVFTTPVPSGKVTYVRDDVAKRERFLFDGEQLPKGDSRVFSVTHKDLERIEQQATALAEKRDTDVIVALRNERNDWATRARGAEEANEKLRAELSTLRKTMVAVERARDVMHASANRAADESDEWRARAERAEKRLADQPPEGVKAHWQETIDELTLERDEWKAKAEEATGLRLWAQTNIGVPLVSCWREISEGRREAWREAARQELQAPKP